MLRIILIGAFVLGIAYVAITYTNLWVGNDKLKGVNQSLTTQLADTTSALKTARGFIYGQENVITRLISTTANQAGQIADYRVRDADTQARLYRGQALQAETDQKLKATVGTLNKAQQLNEANRSVAGFGVVGTTDSAKIAEIAGLKKAVSKRDTTIDELRVEVSNQSDNADKQKRRALLSEERESALEQELNHKSNADADQVEQANAKKHFLGIGKGRTIQKAANDIRANRVN